MERRLSLLKEFAGRYRAVILFIAVGFVLYANAFQNQMFWDDNDSILKNAYVTDWSYFLKYFTENLIAGAGFFSNFWRPALLSVFSLEWHLWGGWLAGYHFVSASFHIVNAILLFFILSFLFRKRMVAMLTALIFLVHPLQTEAVTYVAGMGDSLSVLFMFSGILLFLKFRASKIIPQKSVPYFLSLLMYALALMSKETAVMMPALIFIADFFLVRRNQKRIAFKENVKAVGRTVWPFLIIGGLYILLRATVLNFGDTFNLYGEENAFTSNFHIRIFTFFRVLASYFGLLFWPVGLHMERSVEIATSLFSPSVIIGGLIFLGLSALAVSQFKRYPILSFGIFWFFIGLAPTSNILIPINGLMYEHWLYLPMAGVFLILVWLGELVAKKYNSRNVFLSAVTVFVIFLSVLTINRNRDWRDPITFYNQTLKYSPDSYRVINNLGMAYDDRQNYALAETTYKRAISVSSSSPVAYHNLGNTYKNMDRIDLAIENYNIAIRLDPKFFFSYNALVNIYLESKNYKEARNVLENYIDYGGPKPETLFLLAQIAGLGKDYVSSLSYLEKAQEVDPQNEAVRSSILELKRLLNSNLQSGG